MPKNNKAWPRSDRPSLADPKVIIKNALEPWDFSRSFIAKSGEIVSLRVHFGSRTAKVFVTHAKKA